MAFRTNDPTIWNGFVFLMMKARFFQSLVHHS